MFGRRELSLWCRWTGRKRRKRFSLFSTASSSSSSDNYFCHQVCLLPAPGGPSHLWWFFLVFNLLLLSRVSEECPNTCQCKWVSGKESVSCFRAGLTKIPDGLDPGTQVLNMSGNGLTSLPGNVFLSMNLLNLQKIFLSDCALVSLDPRVFSKLTNLVELELSSNRLRQIPSATFGEIPELRELKLNGNPIGRIPDDAFLGLRRLVRLELTNCQLSIIEPRAFRQLPALEWLRLDNNRLLTVKAESFFPLQSLHGLKISGNPWNCSCSLKPFRIWMLKNNVPFEGIPPICQEPGRLRNKPWDRLQLQDFACLPKVETYGLPQEERIQRAREGQNATFVCRLEATSDTHVSWTVGSRGIPVTNGSNSWGGGGTLLLTESFVSGRTSSSSSSLGKTGGDTTLGDSNKNRSQSSSSSALLSLAGGGGDGGRLDRSLGIKSSTLTIIQTTPRDAGLYTCRGESPAGVVTANFSLLVLQNKAENLTGRLLLTGTLTAVLLTVIVCLLLSCVCLLGRHRQQQQQQQQQHISVINHQQDKIELNHINSTASSAGQNGGQGLSNHHGHHHNTRQYNHVNNISSNTAAANSVQHRTRPPERTRDYRALPTTDPEEEENNDDDVDQWDSNPSTTTTTTAAVRQPKFSNESGQEIVYDNTITTPALSPSPPPASSSATTRGRVRVPGGEAYPAPSSHSRQQQQQSARDKFPDLIDEKMSSSTSLMPTSSASDFVSLPRPNRNPDHNNSSSSRPSYFHRRMNSESQSPLLSAYYSYSNSFDSHSFTSSESLAYQATGPHQHAGSGHHRVYHQQQRYPHHYSHHHSTSSIKYTGGGGGGSGSGGGSGGGTPWKSSSGPADRLSMPTSPLHEHHPHSNVATYDYHAAQLAAFLEEYRILQLELMRMSASLKQQSPQQQQQELENFNNGSASNNNMGNANIGGAPGASSGLPPTGRSPLPTTASSLLLEEQQEALVSIAQPGQPQQQQQQQLKSILKNPTNNNYVA